MKQKIILSLVIGVLLTVSGAFLMHKQDEVESSGGAFRPYEIGDGIWHRYYMYGTDDSLKNMIKKKFDGDSINNIDKIRFDKPGTPEYEINPELQYFHPKGGNAPFYKGGVGKEVYPESKTYYTFGNHLNRTEIFYNTLQNNGIDKSILPNQDVFEVLTHIKPAVCLNSHLNPMQKETEMHDINILPWPQKIENKNKIITFNRGGCFKHPEGWMYFLYVGHSFSYKDVLNNKKRNKK